MAIALGSTVINKIWLGSTELKKIYHGATLIHDKTGGDPEPGDALAANAIYIDFADLSTLFQERTGPSATTPVTANTVIGSVQNKGTLGGWFTAPSDAARPLLRTDGTLYWAEGGTSKELRMTLSPGVALSTVSMCIGGNGDVHHTFAVQNAAFDNNSRFSVHLPYSGGATGYFDAFNTGGGRQSANWHGMNGGDNTAVGVATIVAGASAKFVHWNRSTFLSGGAPSAAEFSVDLAFIEMPGKLVTWVLDFTEWGSGTRADIEDAVAAKSGVSL